MLLNTVSEFVVDYEETVFFLLLGVFMSGVVWGQVTLTIDSVDLSRTNDKIKIRTHPIVYAMNNGIPRIRIIASVNNATDQSVWIFFPEVKKDMALKFSFKGMVYNKRLSMREYKSYFYPGVEYAPLFESIIIPPRDTATIELWTFFPASSRTIAKMGMGMSEMLYVNYPKDWRWKRDKLSDEDYVAWFKEVLPQMQLVISYANGEKRDDWTDKLKEMNLGDQPVYRVRIGDVFQREINVVTQCVDLWRRGYMEVVSQPIDLDKMVVTSGLTDEKLF